MKRMLKFLFPIVGAALVWVTATAADRQTTETMEAKLLNSKNLFEGIVTEDFKQVADSAEKLHALSQSSGWSIRQNTEYQRYTREFARQAKALQAAADAKNIDGATLAYFQMTMTCVNCHRHMKGSEQASISADNFSEKLLASFVQ